MVGGTCGKSPARRRVVPLVTLPRAVSFRDTWSKARDDRVPAAGQRRPRARPPRPGPVRAADGSGPFRRAMPSTAFRPVRGSARTRWQSARRVGRRPPSVPRPATGGGPPAPGAGDELVRRAADAPGALARRAPGGRAPGGDARRPVARPAARGPTADRRCAGARPAPRDSPPEGSRPPRTSPGTGASGRPAPRMSACRLEWRDGQEGDARRAQRDGSHRDVERAGAGPRAVRHIEHRPVQRPPVQRPPAQRHPWRRPPGGRARPTRRAPASGRVPATP